jgi:hypothetical protein
MSGRKEAFDLEYHSPMKKVIIVGIHDLIVEHRSIGEKRDYE